MSFWTANFCGCPFKGKWPLKNDKVMPKLFQQKKRRMVKRQQTQCRFMWMRQEIRIRIHFQRVIKNFEFEFSKNNSIWIFTKALKFQLKKKQKMEFPFPFLNNHVPQLSSRTALPKQRGAMLCRRGPLSMSGRASCANAISCRKPLGKGKWAAKWQKFLIWRSSSQCWPPLWMPPWQLPPPLSPLAWGKLPLETAQNQWKRRCCGISRRLSGIPLGMILSRPWNAATQRSEITRAGQDRSPGMDRTAIRINSVF